MNTLYYSDNLDILRDEIPSDCVDLIYFDPPFQSGKNYNIILQIDVLFLFLLESWPSQFWEGRPALASFLGAPLNWDGFL
jgi:hypothetical protein